MRATVEYIKESSFILSGLCYGWDSRGLGWEKKYKDGNYWESGHWIDGKIINKNTKK